MLALGDLLCLVMRVVMYMNDESCYFIQDVLGMHVYS
jgi:hypothetical protein